MTAQMDAARIVAELGMQPHPEGGHFRETFRDSRQSDGRSVGTAIYYLLAAGELSHWHRVDAAEIWHHYAGAPLELTVAGEGGAADVTLLGGDVLSGQRPQAIVPACAWQTARSLGDWSLVGCTVAPGFEFAGFEMAPDGFAPAARPAGPTAQTGNASLRMAGIGGEAGGDIAALIERALGLAQQRIPDRQMAIHHLEEALRSLAEPGGGIAPEDLTSANDG